jgi:bifunctional UDP-N-acetylglucosamine pyrophosphorylase/glucosamine-1-phosphate N-acetyltransferase
MPTRYTLARPLFFCYWSSAMALHAVILAAGLGTRMRSPLPKVLHDLAGLPLIDHVVAAALAAGAESTVVVVGHGAAEVRRAVRARFGEEAVAFALQKEQRGTGHAVRCALGKLPARGDVMILYGDLPLVSASTLRALVSARRRARTPLALATLRLAPPNEYGRVVRNGSGRVQRIVEARDASAEELRIPEINTGLYAVEASFLRSGVRRLRPENVQREYYLTDLVGMASADGGVSSVEVVDAGEVQGVNSRADLAAAETLWRRRRAQALMLAGVRVEDPERLYLDVDSSADPDARIGAGVHLRGRTQVGSAAIIGPGAVLRDCRIGARAKVGANAVLEGVDLEPGAEIGALAWVRGRR